MDKKASYEELQQKVKELENEALERKCADEFLKREKMFSVSIIDSLPGIFYFFDNKGKFLRWNKNLEDISEYSAEEISTMSPLDFFIDKDKAKVSEKIRETFAKGRSSEEAVVLSKSGNEFCFYLTGRLVLIDSESYLVGMGIDITERKRAEEALREAELSYRTVADFTYDWEYWVGLGGTLRYISPSVERITGYQAQEFIDNPALLREIVVPGDRESWDKHRHDSIKKLKSHEIQFRIMKRDGEICWIEHACTPVKDHEGGPLGFRASNRDITDRKKAEEALRRITKAVDSASDAIGMSDPQGHHFYQNTAFTDLFEYAVEELEAAGGGPAVYADPDIARDVFENIMNGKSWSGEIEMLSKSGRKFPVDLRADAIKDDKGEIIGLIGVHTDITDRKEAEEAVKESTEKIKLFAYSVSHDLKNPAIGINLLTKRLHKKYKDNLDEEGRYHFDLILKASEQLANLVERINIYISTKEAPLNIESVNLNQVFDTVREEFAAQITVRQIKWAQTENSPDIPVDRLSVLRAVRNFVDNALKYGGDELSEIEIGYEESDAFHIISVRDDGIGIAEEDSKKIFTPFKRSLTSIGIEGSGLGLSIAHEIANQHKGKVWAEFGSEKGITFYMSFSKDLKITK